MPYWSQKCWKLVIPDWYARLVEVAMPWYRHCRRCWWVIPLAKQGWGLQLDMPWEPIARIWPSENTKLHQLHCCAHHDTNVNVMLGCTKIQHSYQSHYIWVFRRTFFQMSTTAWLSQWKSILCLAQWIPHVWTATSIANSSFHAIVIENCLGDQWPLPDQ